MCLCVCIFVHVCLCVCVRMHMVVHTTLNHKVNAFTSNLHYLQPSSSGESPTPLAPTTTKRDEAAADGDSPTSTPPPQSSVTSDPITGLQATVPKDFHIFINLVDLCR